MGLTAFYTVEHDGKIELAEMYTIATVLLKNAGFSKNYQFGARAKVRVNNFAQVKQVKETLQDLLGPREYIQGDEMSVGENKWIWLRLSKRM